VPSTKKADPKHATAQVREYLVKQPPEVRKRLRAIRDAVRSLAPDATEVFSYRIPGFRLDGKAFVWYAGFAHHTSLFPIGAAIRTRYAADLEGYQTSTGTVQFPLSKPLPLALVKRLVRARMAEARAEKRKRP